MKGSYQRRAAQVAFVAGVVVVAMASAAFACTEQRGKITMTGVQGTTGSAVYHGKGGDTIATGYCTAPSRETFTTADPAAALTFRLDFESPSSCLATHLAEGVYEVRWVEADEAVELNSPGAPNCHFGIQQQDPANPWVVLGEMALVGTSMSGTFALPANPVGAAPATTVGPGNICLQRVHPTVDVGVPPTIDATAQNWAPPVIFMKWTTV